MFHYLQNFTSNYNEITTGIDPIIDQWLFMKSPGPIVGILIVYLFFVLKAGPKWMENRKPFELKHIMVGYNAYQVCFSIWLCSQIFNFDRRQAFNISCNTKNSQDTETMLMIWSNAWWYFFSKIVELLDTVFFVLRKKQNQVSFLHVYHHSITAFFSWGYLKYLPGEQGLVIGFLNSFVHIIMYFYYMVSAMGPKYQKYIWWKKYMTWIQLTQFGIMLTYLLSIWLLNCKLHKSLTYFFAVNITVFMYLFADFYRKAYVKKNKALAAKEHTLHQNGMTANGVKHKVN